MSPSALVLFSGEQEGLQRCSLRNSSNRALEQGNPFHPQEETTREARIGGTSRGEQLLVPWGIDQTKGQRKSIEAAKKKLATI